MQNPSRQEKPLHFGFILSPSFTLSAFSNFIDALRLASDDNDLSRQIRIKWTVMNPMMSSVKASCGLELTATSTLVSPENFDYIVVVGGLIHAGKRLSPDISSYLVSASKMGVPLIGICTGSFILARLGLMDGKRSCISWFHYKQFVEEFPHLDAQSQEIFIADRNRITCAGGTGAVHLASYLIEKHINKYEAARSLRIMIEENSSKINSNALQPLPITMRQTENVHVKRAMLLIEQNIREPLSTSELALKTNLSVRHLERLFRTEVNMTPAIFCRYIRLQRAHDLLLKTQQLVTRIGEECGFNDGAHFSRVFRQQYGYSPTELRARR